MTTRNAFSRWAGPLAIGLSGLAAAVLSHWPAATAALQFDREAVAAGQLWRLIACHWTHWTDDHLIWDLIVYLGLGWTCVLMNPRATARTLALASLLVGAGVWLLLPEMTRYRGLSGLDSALFVLLALQLAARLPANRRLLIHAALLAFLAKTAYEAATAATLFAASGDAFIPVPAAHLLGGLAALLALAVARRKPPVTQPFPQQRRRLA